MNTFIAIRIPIRLDGDISRPDAVGNVDLPEGITIATTLGDLLKIAKDRDWLAIDVDPDLVESAGDVH
jgi:hypothetical protein